MLGRVWHYARAVERRLFLVLELRRLAAAGKPVPAALRRLAWKHPSEAEDWVNLLGFLDPRARTTLLDVGANVGRFAADFLAVFPDTRAYCVEPTAGPFQAIQDRFRGDGRVTALRCAASDADGTARMTLATDSTYSTLNPYTADGALGRGFVPLGEEEVPLRRLDGLGLDLAGTQVVLKLDVQGHELPALRGATGLLEQVDAVLAELSFANQYEGQPPSFSAVAALLAGHDLFPVVFQDYGFIGCTYAFERDVLFVRRGLLDKVWHRNS